MIDITMIRKWVLQNAVKYDGKPNPGAVIGKLLAEDATLKNSMKELAQQVNAIAGEVRKLSVQAQRKELEALAPELLVEKKTEETHELPPLDRAIEGKVITAFPPEPSGVAHIGHASGALFNMMYAQRYNGKFILRFEDTNPELAKPEYYTAITELLGWIGIKWDKLIRISDTIPDIYAKAEALIEKGLLYACNCPVEIMRDRRGRGEECEHRSTSSARNLIIWKEMLDGKHDEGSYVIRFKGNMTDQNTVMRDPTMFRISKKEHCIHGMKYCVWPGYDFAAAYSDGVEGVTHRVRGKEFELRAVLQRNLQRLMGFAETHIIEQARINLEGVEASKRKIREKIESGELTGWDDPRLSTLITLKRRGFVPEGIKNFLIGVGITKNERTLGWASLEAENRKILDPMVNRYFFVANPEKIVIAGAPEQTAEVPLHPDKPERGNRSFKTHLEFWLSAEDVAALKQRNLYRIMDCANFTLTSKGFKYHSRSIDDYREKGKRIMHWLPSDAEQTVPVEVVMPDASVVKGLGELALSSLCVGDIVQFTRFGFARVDQKLPDKIVMWYAHK